jgi:oxygen-dependent protoporphyrinogen oxidase
MSDSAPRSPRVIVVGGGISGLAAAWQLTRRRHDLEVVVLEGSSRVGGILRVSEVEGIPLDEGAESMLATRPEAVQLARDVGLSAQIVHPTAAKPRVLVNGELREFPPGLMMGVPTDLRTLAASGVLSPEALARIPLDYVLPRTAAGDDVSLGAYISQRLGDEVVDRLVAPLIMGVYADDPYAVSMRSATPALLEAAQKESSLLSAARRIRRPPSGPVFAGVDGGIGCLPVALEAALDSCGASVRTNITVRGIRRTATGWALDTTAAGVAGREIADAVIVATPAPAAARLLSAYVPLAAEHLRQIETVSVAVVTLLYRIADLPGGDLPEGSGYLVPPSQGRPVKAATFSSHKWAWVDRLARGQGLVAARASLGHARDVEVLQRTDTELVDLAASDLGFVARLGRARPIASRVTRWGGALPRYEVGFADRVSMIDMAVRNTPALALCGSAYEGVGIASCVARATAAADRICDHLRSDGQWMP